MQSGAWSHLKLRPFPYRVINGKFAKCEDHNIKLELTQGFVLYMEPNRVMVIGKLDDDLRVDYDDGAIIEGERSDGFTEGDLWWANANLIPRVNGRAQVQAEPQPFPCYTCGPE